MPSSFLSNLRWRNNTCCECLTQCKLATSTKMALGAPRSKAPMPKMPLPAPKSTTALGIRCKFDRLHAHSQPFTHGNLPRFWKHLSALAKGTVFTCLHSFTHIDICYIWPFGTWNESQNFWGASSRSAKGSCPNGIQCKRMHSPSRNSSWVLLGIPFLWHLHLTNLQRLLIYAHKPASCCVTISCIPTVCAWCQHTSFDLDFCVGCLGFDGLASNGTAVR